MRTLRFASCDIWRLDVRSLARRVEGWDRAPLPQQAEGVPRSLLLSLDIFLSTLLSHPNNAPTSVADMELTPIKIARKSKGDYSKAAIAERKAMVGIGVLCGNNSRD